MALRIGQAQSVKFKFISTLMMVFALAVQPVYGFVASQVANAAAVVTSTDAQGWNAQDGSPTFVAGPSGADGIGSLKLTTQTEAKQNYFHAATGPLSQAANLGYKLKVEAGIPASYQLQVVGANRIDNSASGFTSLVWEPVYNGQPNGPNGQFVTESNLENGTWWSSNAIAGAPNRDTFVSLSSIIAANPNATVIAYGVGVGSGTPNSTSYVDDVSFQANSANFETIPYMPTPPPTRPSLSGDTIYDSIPNTLPSNSPSLGFEATSTKAFGDKITFTGTSSRALDKVAVNLSSWACENGAWSNGCVTTPGATFSQPVTLNIYNVANDGTAGSLIATKTQTFSIPYRPTADPTCAAATQWRDTNGNCSNGLNHVVTFDASGITVPHTIIYSIAYNTRGYGDVPTGTNGPSDSLNVALSTTNSVGTNVNPDEVFWDTTYPGYTGGLKADDGWSADGNPAVVFTAVPRLGAPTNPYPADNAYINTNNFDFRWSEVSGAVSYEWQGSNTSSHTNADGSLTDVKWTGDYQGHQPTAAMAHSQGASGTWYWQVRAIDSSGIPGTWSPVWTMTIDTTAPTAPINLGWKTSTNTTIANNGVTKDANGTAVWQASSSSDVDHYVYKYWNEIAGNQYKAGSEYATNVSGTSLAGAFNQGEGVHHFCVEAVDRAGNPSTCTEFTITYDKTKPTVQNLTLDHTLVNSSTVVLNGKVNDDNLSDYQVRVQTSAHVNTNPYIGASGTVNTDGTLASLNVSGLKDGNYVVRLWATDKAGNSTGNDGITTYYLPFTIDRTAPTVKINNPTRNSDGTYTITGTTDDPADVMVRVEGLLLSNVHRSGNNWNVTTAVALDSGNHVVTATSTDQAGNSGSATPQSFTVPTAVVGTSGGVSTPSQPSRQVSTQTTASTGTQGPVGFTNGINPNLVATTDGTGTTTPTTTDTNGNVLGTSDTKKSDMPTTNADTQGEVKGASTTTWNIFGLAWYWWLLILAVIAGLIWWIVAARRRSSEV